MKFIVPVANMFEPAPSQFTTEPDCIVRVVLARMGPPIPDPERLTLRIPPLGTVTTQLPPPIAKRPVMVSVPEIVAVGEVPPNAIVPANVPVADVVTVNVTPELTERTDPPAPSVSAIAALELFKVIVVFPVTDIEPTVSLAEIVGWFDCVPSNVSTSVAAGEVRFGFQFVEVAHVLSVVPVHV